jgi:hypothetical protein
MEVGFGTLFNKVNLILITEMIYRPAFKVSGQRRRVDPNSVVESVVKILLRCQRNADGRIQRAIPPDGNAINHSASVGNCFPKNIAS